MLVELAPPNQGRWQCLNLIPSIYKLQKRYFFLIMTTTTGFVNQGSASPGIMVITPWLPVFMRIILHASHIPVLKAAFLYRKQLTPGTSGMLRGGGPEKSKYPPDLKIDFICSDRAYADSSGLTGYTKVTAGPARPAGSFNVLIMFETTSGANNSYSPTRVGSVLLK